MKKVVLLLMLTVCLITVSVSAWSADQIVKGDVIYKDDGDDPKK
jgi:hypothetical protein